jgi:hypothetical protein
MLQIFRGVLARSVGPLRQNLGLPAANKSFSAASAAICWPPVPDVKLTEQQAKSRAHFPNLIVVESAGARETSLRVEQRPSLATLTGGSQRVNMQFVASRGSS